MDILLMGAPGAGKGTQAELLKEKMSYRHISTGDVLRKEIASGSRLGQQIAAIINDGNLVPDELMLSMLKQIVSSTQENIIFDGFPRTVVQARMLDEMLAQLGRKLGKVVEIALPDEKVVARLSARKQCKLPGGEIKQIGPDFSLEQCKAQGGEIFTRPDDSAESIAHRLVVYHKQTEPVIAFYRKADRFVRINGDQAAEKVLADLLNVLKA